MKLTEGTAAAFTEALASDAPAPGGGSAAALMGAQGAALVAMVCALTEGSAKYAPRQPRAGAIRAEAEALRLRLLELVDRDTESFLTVSAAYAMPKATEAERSARSAAIQEGLALCTRTPLEVMTLSARGLALAEELASGFNENAASDLGVAALSLEAGLRGAWYNVEINVGSLKDRELAETCRRQGEALLAEAEARSGAARARVEALLQTP